MPPTLTTKLAYDACLGGGVLLDLLKGVLSLGDSVCFSFDGYFPDFQSIHLANMTNIKHFVDGDDIVRNALQGLTTVNPYLQIDLKNKAVFNGLHDANKTVTVISGGGAGHEPAFAAYVGQGLLSAAVSGNIFASPSALQVTNTILQAGGQAGTILIIMNYTGDVLHFRLAAEKARISGHKAEVLIVGDDVSVGRERSGRVGRRGLAGTVLVEKIVGAAAQAGITWENLLDLGKEVADNLATVGVALDHVHVPGHRASESSLTASQVELGMGIHNEPGCKVLEPQPSIEELVGAMLTQLLDQNDSDRAYVNFGDAEEVVVLVNNLGGVSQLEFYAIVKVVVEQLGSKNIKPSRVYAGVFMTSLDSRGFSITLLKTKSSIREYLDVLTDAPGWSPAVYSAEAWQQSGQETIKSIEDEAGPERTESSLQLDLEQLRGRLVAACEHVIEAEPRITEYDTIVGDGDCGMTLKRAAEAVIDALNSGKVTADAVQAVDVLAGVVEDNMDGTSGALYAIFVSALAASLKGISNGFSSQKAITKQIWASAMLEAFRALQKATPARIGDRTLMDALEPFIEELSQSNGENLAEALQAATAGKEKTKGMRPAFGRSVYVQESGWDQVPDPGAEGVVCLLQGLCEK